MILREEWLSQTTQFCKICIIFLTFGTGQAMDFRLGMKTDQWPWQVLRWTGTRSELHDMERIISKQDSGFWHSQPEHYADVAYRYRRSGMVCQSVTTGSSLKTAE